MIAVFFLSVAMRLATCSSVSFSIDALARGLRAAESNLVFSEAISSAVTALGSPSKVKLTSSW